MGLEGKKRPYDLEDRLVQFAGDCILCSRNFTNDVEGGYFKNQLVRASSSAALNYGEAQGTLTDSDFIYKAGLSVKELKECKVIFKILNYVKVGEENEIENLQSECKELISILSKMIINKKNKE